MTAAPPLSWELVAALVALIGVAAAASRVGRIGVERSIVGASVRAIVQLALVAVVIGAVLDRRWASALFALAMFAVAVVTAAGRVGARPSWPWIAAAIASGVVPVLAIIFAFDTAALSGPAIIAIAGIIIGGAMTAHTLTARRAFDAMRAERGQVDAGLSPWHSIVTTRSRS